MTTDGGGPPCFFFLRERSIVTSASKESRSSSHERRRSSHEAREVTARSARVRARGPRGSRRKRCPRRGSGFFFPSLGRRHARDVLKKCDTSSHRRERSPTARADRGTGTCGRGRRREMAWTGTRVGQSRAAGTRVARSRRRGDEKRRRLFFRRTRTLARSGFGRRRARVRTPAAARRRRRDSGRTYPRLWSSASGRFLVRRACACARSARFAARASPRSRARKRGGDGLAEFEFQSFRFA